MNHQPLPMEPWRLPSCESTVAAIFDEVSESFGVSIAVLQGSRGQARHVWARQVACAFIREKTSLSLTDIGNRLGGRDHGTVIHALKTVQNLTETYPRLAKEIQELRIRIEKRIQTTNHNES